MSQAYVTDAGTMIIPSAKATYKVQPSNSGLATSGVIMLVGEADAGPHWSDEEDLEANAFGPDQLASVVAKYLSGPVVDAYRVACVPANDPGILGSPSRFIIAKTNTSTKASLQILNLASGLYGTFYDKSYGATGNHIYTKITSAQAEVLPTTGLFTWIPQVGDITVKMCGSGISRTTLIAGDQIAAATDPAGIVTYFAGKDDILAAGGVKKVLALSMVALHTIAFTHIGAVTDNTVTITNTLDTWGVTPVAGDTLIVPAGSLLAGAGNVNIGAYVVTSSTTTVISATKLSNYGSGAAVADPVAHPLTVIPVVPNDADEFMVFGSISISYDGAQSAGTMIDGIGQSLELADAADVSGQSLADACYLLGTTTKVAWVSTAAAPKLLTATEYRVNVANSRTSTGSNESITVGGDIALRLSYARATCVAATVTISDTQLTTAITGFAGDNLTLNFADYPTIADLVAAINAAAGYRYRASVPSAVTGNLSPEILDNVTTKGILSSTIPSTSLIAGAGNCRIKMDAYKFAKAITDNSALVQFNDPVLQATAGLPIAMAVPGVLAGGSKGSTTAAAVTAAINALEMVSGNFLVPCFSRDATADYALGLTESGSTYTIDGVHLGAKNHVIAMSTLKKGRNRQAFLAIDDTFLNAQEKAATIASFRCSMNFQGPKALASDGTVETFGSWMAAAYAAGMQGAAFYRPIFNKGINASGFVQAALDFDDRNDTNVEDALLAGLMPARRDPTGFWKWASDQTTYGQDTNFVFNSIQAVYVADMICTTTSQRMERAFVGQSVADISAAVALTYLETIMSDFLRLKLITSSDDARKGFKNASIQISGGAMIVSAEIKLAGAIYFIPISFLITPVTQTATL